MKQKPIKLEWDDLDAAFSNQNTELVYYLDLVTGYVVLEGEGEEDDFDDEEEAYGANVPQQPRNDSTRLYIDPPDHDLKLEWLKRFMAESDDLGEEVKSELTAAFDAEDRVAAINDVLRRHPEGRDQWYLYRSERKQDLIDEWIKKHAIETVDPPPWRS